MPRAAMFTMFLSLAGTFFLLVVLVPLIGLICHQPAEALWVNLRDPEVLGALGLTAGCSFLAVALGLLTGVPLAYLLARRTFPGKSLLSAVVNLPVVVPHPVAGMALLVVLSRGSLIGSVLDRTLGLTLVGSMPGVVVALYFVSAPLIVNAARAAFEQVDLRLEHMAASLGASPAHAFRTVVLPLARRGILHGAILALARAMSEFGSLMILAYFPKTATVLIWDRFNSHGLAAAVPIAVLLLGIGLLLFLPLQWAANPHRRPA